MNPILIKQQKDQNIELINSIRNKDSISKIRKIINYGADVNYKDENGITPILIVLKDDYVYNNNYDDNDNYVEEVVKLLLEKGANINYKDRDGRSCIIEASVRGLKKVVKLLLENGANPNDKNRYGSSPIILASLRGYDDVVKVLLDYGANPDDRDKDGKSALNYAINQNNINLVNLLLSNGATIPKKFEKQFEKILDQRRSMMASHIIKQEMLNGQYTEAQTEKDLAEYMGAKGGRKRRKQKSNKNKRKSRKNKRKSIKRRK